MNYFPRKIETFGGVRSYNRASHAGVISTRAALTTDPLLRSKPMASAKGRRTSAPLQAHPNESRAAGYRPAGEPYREFLRFYAPFA
jgi:hypothetical protein